MARRGFLTLSACDNPASTTCAECGNPMCAAHLSPGSGFTKCYDCANRTVVDDDTVDDPYDDDWSYRQRRTYYHDSGYTPLATDDFDETDADGFDAADSGALDDDDRAGGSFGDS